MVDKVPGHRIEIDPSREFMRLTLWGDWANAQNDQLGIDHAKAVQDMKTAGARHGRFLTLVDIREKRLREREVVAEFRRSIATNSPSRRIAIIVARDLPTSMAAEMAEPGHVLIAYSEDAAMAWLFADSTESRPGVATLTGRADTDLTKD